MCRERHFTERWVGLTVRRRVQLPGSQSTFTLDSTQLALWLLAHRQPFPPTRELVPTLAALLSHFLVR